MKRHHILILLLIATYHVWRCAYYGAFLPHAYLAKCLLPYYHSQPLHILATWWRYAAVIPLAATIGIVMERRLRWLGVYLLLSAASCLLGPNSDWCRYTVHLLPLMLVASAPLFRWCSPAPHPSTKRPVLAPVAPTRRRLLAAAAYFIILTQAYYSVVWMRGNAAALAYPQSLRKEMGLCLYISSRPDLGDVWVVSNDLGSIAYHAPDCKFIDLTGLTSRDVYEARKAGHSATSIMERKRPQYVADTVNIEGGEYVYQHDVGGFKDYTFHRVKPFSDRLAVAVVGLTY